MIELIRHLFLPHHTNNHRPKLLHIDALTIYVIFFGLVYYSLNFIGSSHPEVLGYATDIYVNQLLQDTNIQRQQAGLSPLQLNTQLSSAAYAKAQNMFALNYWAHNSPDGKTPWDFISNAGYKYSVAGENLAKNFSTSQAVVDAWMASPSHRENVLKAAYKEVGFAVVNGKLNNEETTLVVQMFGSSNALSQVQNKPIVPQVAAVSTLESTPPVVEKIVTNTKNISNQQHSEPIIVEKTTLSQSLPNAGISVKPMVNIPTVTRYMSLIFIVIVMLILVVDAYLISKRKIVRITGHNIAHILFLSALLIAVLIATRGSVL